MKFYKILKHAYRCRPVTMVGAMCQIYQAIHRQNRAKLRCGRIEYKFNQNSILYLISSKCSESVTCKLKIQSQSDPILASRSTKKTSPLDKLRTDKKNLKGRNPRLSVLRAAASILQRGESGAIENVVKI